MTAATLPGLTRPAPMAVRAPLIAFSYSAMKLGDQGKPLSGTPEIHGGENSNAAAPQRRPTPARTSAASLLGFFGAEFIERPRIVRLDRLGLAEIELGAIWQGEAAQRRSSLLGLLGNLADAWSARLARDLGGRAQGIGRANADGLRLARGLYGRGVEAERRPSVGDPAGARLPVEQQPVRFGLRGKVLGSAAGRVRDG